MKNPYQGSRRLSRPKQAMIILWLLLGLAGSFSVAYILISNNRNMQPPTEDKEFERVIGLSSMDGVILMINGEKFTHNDIIHVWIDNETKYTLHFKDSSYELKSYKFDGEKRQWNITQSYQDEEPREFVIEPYSRSYLDGIPIDVWSINAVGRIRLAVKGFASNGQPFVAWKDIEIAE